MSSSSSSSEITRIITGISQVITKFYEERLPLFPPPPSIKRKDGKQQEQNYVKPSMYNLFCPIEMIVVNFEWDRAMYLRYGNVRTFIQHNDAFVYHLETNSVFLRSLLPNIASHFDMAYAYQTDIPIYRAITQQSRVHSDLFGELFTTPYNTITGVSDCQQLLNNQQQQPQQDQMLIDNDNNNTIQDLDNTSDSMGTFKIASQLMTTTSLSPSTTSSNRNEEITQQQQQQSNRSFNRRNNDKRDKRGCVNQQTRTFQIAIPVLLLLFAIVFGYLQIVKKAPIRPIA